MPITLRRCDVSQDVLCLITFGLEPPDRMVVTLLRAPGMPDEIRLVVTYLEKRLDYECKFAETAPTVLYCIGPQIPLGSTVLLEVYSIEHDALLARGEFNLMAFALPTVPQGGVALPTPAPATPPAARTATPVDGYPNPTPFLSPEQPDAPVPGSRPGPRPFPTSNSLP